MRLLPLALTTFFCLSACVDTEVPQTLPEADASAADDATTPAADAAPGADAPEVTADAGTPAADADTPLVDAGFPPDAEPVIADAGFAPDAAAPPLSDFSFFVTSIEAMRQLSGSQDGFGGNLSYGGAQGVLGADNICTAIAELSMPGSGAKGWRAFLSASTGGADGGALHAIERIGSGPWYDRNGRLVANDIAGLTTTRPAGNAQITNDLPNERGESQRNQPGANGQGTADNHDILTGSSASGRFQGGAASTTCNDWTSAATGVGRPQLGHSWPAQSGQGWSRAHTAAGCEAVVNLVQNGPGSRTCTGVGCGGGYGGIYCFALQP